MCNELKKITLKVVLFYWGVEKYARRWQIVGIGKGKESEKVIESVV